MQSCFTKYNLISSWATHQVLFIPKKYILTLKNKLSLNYYYRYMQKIVSLCVCLLLSHDLNSRTQPYYIVVQSGLTHKLLFNPGNAGEASGRGYFLIILLQAEVTPALAAYDEARMMVDVQLIKDKRIKVVGMTTSGAGRMRKLLKAIAPKIGKTITYQVYNFYGANEQMASLMVSNRRRLWTPETPESKTPDWREELVLW